MKPIVAVVDFESFSKAIDIIGGIDDLNRPDRRLVVKVGIYNAKTGICTTPKNLNSIIDSFDLSPEILIAESDSSAGPGLERLEIWNECYNEKVVPFNLSNDPRTNEVEITGERVPFSHVFSEHRTFISTHVSRRYEQAGKDDIMSLGSIIKNLLGLILDKKKYRFHKDLPTALVDLYEAAGGIDLAVLDGTTVHLGFQKKRVTLSPNVLLVGRDAFAVEAVGLHMVGLDPLENPMLLEARKRNLGEIDLEKIEIVGDIETPRMNILEAFDDLVQP